MSKFEVIVTRTSYAHRRFEVEAETKDVAEFKALEMAGDYEFSESTADYAAAASGFIE